MPPKNVRQPKEPKEPKQPKVPKKPKQPKQPKVPKEPKQPKVTNRGTGAGGANTTKNGSSFEMVAEQNAVLHSYGFLDIEFGHIRKKPYKGMRLTYAGGVVTMVKQHHATAYMRHHFGIDITYRPDELYIIITTTGEHIFKVLEKKSQNGTGSVIDKLEIGDTRRELYRRILNNRFKVDYAWCLNAYLKNEVMQDTPCRNHFRELLAEQKIAILFGTDVDYAAKLHEWLFAPL